MNDYQVVRYSLDKEGKIKKLYTVGNEFVQLAANSSRGFVSNVFVANQVMDIAVDSNTVFLQVPNRAAGDDQTDEEFYNIMPLSSFIRYGSVTSEAAIYKYGFSLIPKEFSGAAYAMIFKSPEKILNAYGVTILITALGTMLGLTLTSMTAYVLANKNFKYAAKFAFFFYFTTLFGGGLVAYYVWLVRYLHIKNTIFVLFVPQCLNVFNILVMRNFVKSIPHEVHESAKIDGAREFIIYLKIYLPMMKPVLATIALFLALGYWNNWSAAMLYIDNEKLYPLQYLLYQMTSNTGFLANATANAGVPMPEVPQQSMKLALAVITIGPIILAYPFVQKYFVQGISVGAVKG